MVDSVDDIQRCIHEVILPLLLIHGSDDRTVPIAASHLAYNRVSSEDKTLEVSSKL